jgi:hypothetical protein
MIDHTFETNAEFLCLPCGHIKLWYVMLSQPDDNLKPHINHIEWTNGGHSVDVSNILLIDEFQREHFENKLHQVMENAAKT